MAKKLTKKVEAELKQYVNEYGEKKSVYDVEKKAIDKLNSNIKEIMTGYDLEAYDGGDFAVTCTVSEEEAMNEDMLLEVIKSKIWVDKGDAQCPFIKIVEQVDFDALEKAMYLGTFTEEDMLEISKCKETKKKTTLRLKKVKK